MNVISYNGSTYLKPATKQQDFDGSITRRTSPYLAIKTLI